VLQRCLATTQVTVVSDYINKHVYAALFGAAVVTCAVEGQNWGQSVLDSKLICSVYGKVW
jgi:hypothetical protein